MVSRRNEAAVEIATNVAEEGVGTILADEEFAVPRGTAVLGCESDAAGRVLNDLRSCCPRLGSDDRPDEEEDWLILTATGVLPTTFPGP